MDRTPPARPSQRPLARATVLLIAVFALVQAFTGWTWGMPGYRSWAKDAIGGGQVLSWATSGMRYGEGFGGRYPPMHRYVLTATAAPVAGYFYLTQPGVADAAPIDQVPFRTALLRSGRLVTVLMAVGIAILLYRLGAAFGPPGAGWLAVCFWCGGFLTAYYSQTTNLEVPYLLWSVWAIERLTAFHRTGRRSAVILSALFAAAAVATKDQAASLMFALPVMLLWSTQAAAPESQPGSRGRAMLVWLVVAAAAYGLLSQALIRPGDYLSHVRLLFGDGLKGYRAEGLGQWLGDLAGDLTQVYQPVVLLLLLAGVAGALVHRPRIAVWLALPAVTYTACFYVPSQLTSARFLFPIVTLLSVVAGIGVASFLPAPTRPRRAVAWVVLGVAIYASGLLMIVRLHTDLRQEADRWLATRPDITASLGHFYFATSHLPTLAQMSVVRLEPVGDQPPTLDVDYLVISHRDIEYVQVRVPNPALRESWLAIFDSPRLEPVATFEDQPLPWPWDRVYPWTPIFDSVHRDLTFYRVRPNAEALEGGASGLGVPTPESPSVTSPSPISSDTDP